jgi:hypothetical protein
MMNSRPVDNGSLEHDPGDPPIVVLDGTDHHDPVSWDKLDHPAEEDQHNVIVRFRGFEGLAED